MIQTKTITLTPFEYFKIILGVRIQKSWWLYLLLFIIGLLHIENFGAEPFATFFVIMAIISPILTIAQLYFFAVNPKNKIVFIPRTYSIGSDGIGTEMGKREGAIPFSYIVQVRELSKYWLLYINTANFICVPKNSFYTLADHNEFKTIIASIKKNK